MTGCVYQCAADSLADACGALPAMVRPGGCKVHPASPQPEQQAGALVNRRSWRRQWHPGREHLGATAEPAVWLNNPLPLLTRSRQFQQKHMSARTSRKCTLPGWPCAPAPSQPPCRALAHSPRLRLLQRCLCQVLESLCLRTLSSSRACCTCATETGVNYWGRCNLEGAPRLHGRAQRCASRHMKMCLCAWMLLSSYSSPFMCLCRTTLL